MTFRFTLNTLIIRIIYIVGKRGVTDGAWFQAFVVVSGWGLGADLMIMCVGLLVEVVRLISGRTIGLEEFLYWFASPAFFICPLIRG